MKTWQLATMVATRGGALHSMTMAVGSVMTSDGRRIKRDRVGDGMQHGGFKRVVAVENWVVAWPSEPVESIFGSSGISEECQLWQWLVSVVVAVRGQAIGAYISSNPRRWW